MAIGRSTEPRTITATITSRTVSNKALAANVATLTTTAAHGFVAGEQVRVTGVDATFDGVYLIASTPSATTFTYGRTAADVASAASGGTALSTGITAAVGTFHEEDAGRAITGTGIPAGATVASVQSDATARLSAAATAAGSPTVTLGGALGTAYGFTGWSPETDAESETYSLASVNAGQVTPDRMTNTFTSATSLQRGRG